MKNFVCLFLFLLLSSLFAQNKETLYDFTDLPQSLLLNPGAEVYFKGHLGIPLLSQTYINAGVRGFSAYDLFADDGTSFDSKLKSTISNLSNNDHITLTEQLELLTFGWRSKRNSDIYYSGGVYQELDMITYLPRDLFNLALYGNTNKINDPIYFNINFSSNLLAVYHFGITKKVNPLFTYGVRAKIYSSLLNINSTESIGSFTTTETPNGANFYQHILSSSIRVNTAGYTDLRDSQNLPLTVIQKGLLGGNLGLGLDFGFTYEIVPQWSITGSVIDLGKIFYTKNTKSYNINGYYSYKGIETPNNDPNANTQAIGFVEELKQTFPITNSYDNYTVYRPTKVNGSIKYSFNELDYYTCNCSQVPDKTRYTDSFGLQLFTQFRPRTNTYAGSLFYYKRVSNILRFKATYTIDDYSYKNVGAIASFHFNKWNFYTSFNNLLSLNNIAKTTEFAFLLGVNLIF